MIRVMSLHHIEPKHVLIGGALLAFGASFINIGFMMLVGASVSHLTGDISAVATLAVVAGDPGRMLHILHVGVATVGFLVGSVAAGYGLHHPQLELSRPYGRILSVLGLLLIATYFVYNFSVTLALFVGSFVCGVQNALASRYRGMVLRTTHLTGMFTDLGVSLGMRLRGHKVENWRLTGPAALLIGFFIGAAVSSVVVKYWGVLWIAVAGSGYVVGGLTWSYYKRHYLQDSASAAAS